MNGEKINSRKFRHSKKLETSKGRFTADIYVPIELYSYALKRIRQNKNLATYLSNLLQNYKFEILKNQKPHKRERISYQSKSLGLMRISFRPNEQDWAELRTLGRYLGTSMCKAFVLLMDLEKRKSTTKEFLRSRIDKTKCGITSLLQRFSIKNRQIVFELIVDS
ncbi:DUF1564 family protein [Leptospira yasudae]|uniref:DUF1564 family protein n=1 Tax=Leptospira yasudae TaxID=2202201 RepID=A0A6N4QWT1_9LEPT|nr:DUF1564 family protein [Leptospira yasudae]TGL80706.1 DUF1564 family protein [Leptospira yasudae]TGL88947.1 DUF1564 family protein [Leptospira yasudae]